MTDQATIKQLALDSGFKLKEQDNGQMDLNPYVYQFAAALLAPLQETNRSLLAEKAEQREQFAAYTSTLRSALNFYAAKQHLSGIDGSWDSCSGEPDNFLFPPEPVDEEPWMVEDGSVAARAVAAVPAASIAEIQAKAVMDFVSTMIGAFDAGFVDTPATTIGAVYEVARHHVKNNFKFEAKSLFEEVGEEFGEECFAGVYAVTAQNERLRIALNKNYTEANKYAGDLAKFVAHTSDQALKESLVGSTTQIECQGVEKFMKLFAATNESDETINGEVVIDMLTDFIKREKQHAQEAAL